MTEDCIYFFSFIFFFYCHVGFFNLAVYFITYTGKSSSSSLLRTYLKWHNAITKWHHIIFALFNWSKASHGSSQNSRRGCDLLKTINTRRWNSLRVTLSSSSHTSIYFLQVCREEKKKFDLKCVRERLISKMTVWHLKLKIFMKFHLVE